MKHNSRLPLAIAAILGSTLAVSACQLNASGGSASATPSATSSASAASSAPSSSQGGSAGQSSPSAAAVPGVVDCGQSTGTLQFRPAQITLACGDGSDGLDKLNWNNWGTDTATGQGEYYANTCNPDCANGKEADFPVQVTLSGAGNSSRGAYFSQLSITWQGAKPSGAQDSYSLPAPK